MGGLRARGLKLQRACCGRAAGECTTGHEAAWGGEFESATFRPRNQMQTGAGLVWGTLCCRQSRASRHFRCRLQCLRWRMKLAIELESDLQRMDKRCFRRPCALRCRLLRHCTQGFWDCDNSKRRPPRSLLRAALSPRRGPPSPAIAPAHLAANPPLGRNRPPFASMLLPITQAHCPVDSSVVCGPSPWGRRACMAS